MNTLVDLINNSGFDIFFPVVDEFLNFDINSGLTNFYTIFRPELGLKNSGQLLSQPSVVEYIQSVSSKNHRLVAILPFKPSAKIEKICQQYGWKYLANPASLSRLFEDKLKFPSLCQNSNIPVLPFRISQFNEDEFNSAKDEWGTSIVVQTHFGWAGNSTFFAQEFANLESKIPHNTPVKFSPYRDSYTLLNNCCLTSQGLFQSPPALQYTGLPEYTSNPYTTVGRQWPAPISKEIRQQVFNITEGMSKLLKDHQYLGFFGLDFLVDHDEQVHVLECNPRLTASFAFYTALELKNNLNPLLFLHLAEYLKLNFQENQKPETRFNAPIIGSQLTHRLNPQNRITEVKIFDYPLCDSLDSPLKLNFK